MALEVDFDSFHEFGWPWSEEGSELGCSERINYYRCPHDSIMMTLLLVCIDLNLALIAGPR